MSLIKRSNLGCNIRNSVIICTFKKVVNFIRPTENSICNCNNTKGIKLLTRLHLGFCHVSNHKFRHGSYDILNPFCSCGMLLNIPLNLCCPHYSIERITVMDKIRDINKDILNQNDKLLVPTLTFGYS